MTRIIKNNFLALSLILAFLIAFSQPSCFAQNQLKIFEDIGGGGSSAEGSGSNDNTFIYVAGGLLVAGIVAYALLVKKDNSEKTDTTSSSTGSEIILENKQKEPFYSIKRAREKFPLDIFFGIKNDKTLIRSKTYSVGVSLRL